jgi:hypothetical protein
LNDPKAKEIVFRFPTPLVQQALMVIAAEYGIWVKLQISGEGTYILSWILGAGNPIAKKHSLILELEAQVKQFKYPKYKKDIRFFERLVKPINHEAKEKLERNLQEKIRIRDDYFTLHKDVDDIERRLPNSRLRVALIRHISEGRSHGIQHDVDMSVTLAMTELDQFTPMTWNEYRLAQYKKFCSALAEARLQKIALRKERGKAKRSSRLFLTRLVAVEMAA